jgi:hypothetical protein
MATALAIIHGLVAVALLGGITHQTLAAWAPADGRRGSFFSRFRAVKPAAFTNAIVAFYVISTILGAILYLYFRTNVSPRAGERQSMGGPWALRHQGALHCDRIGAPAGLLGVLASPAQRRTRAHARRADLDPCLHRLVEFSHRSRHEQHQGLRVMTSSHAFRRFAFAFGTGFAVFYLLARAQDLALFTVFPTLGVVLPGAQRGNETALFRLPAMHWYGWMATAALGASVLGLVAAGMSERSTRPNWFGWWWLIPPFAMIGCIYLTMPWFLL